MKVNERRTVVGGWLATTVWCICVWIQSSLLVSGWDTVALVDLHDGRVIGQHSLPCQPIGKPVTGDFNKDGWTDFIVLCPEGLVLLLFVHDHCLHHMNLRTSAPSQK